MSEPTPDHSPGGFIPPSSRDRAFGFAVPAETIERYAPLGGSERNRRILDETLARIEARRLADARNAARARIGLRAIRRTLIDPWAVPIARWLTR